MQTGDGLVLRDIHAPVSPQWWPPAPGWWIVFAAVLLLGALSAWWWVRRRRRRQAVAKLFDDALAQAATPPEKIAAMSELLRRAARRRDAQADRLQGDDWLEFLDRGLPQPVFAAGAGLALRDGAFRRDVSDVEVEGLRNVARARFIDWMDARR